jgi:very-short-patch-repair endonuclease
LIQSKLEEVRRRLLDLSRNNRLLNHRAGGQRTLQIVDEVAEQIYHLLVDEGKTLQFLSLEEASEEGRIVIAAEGTSEAKIASSEPKSSLSGEAHPSSPSTSAYGSEAQARRGQPQGGGRAGEEPDDIEAHSNSTEPPPQPSPGVPAEGENAAPAVAVTPASPVSLVSPESPASPAIPAPIPPQPPSLPLAPVAAATTDDRHRDTKLQTALEGDKLQSRLVNLAREANSALQEQGCNILYLTLGMIEWRDAEGSEESSRAPLIFIPVELKRKSVNARYTLQGFDDDIVANPSLMELCQVQFDCSLPAFDAEKDDLAEYFQQAEAAAGRLPGWKFSREIHLGLFSFSKLLMYRDLDPRNWPNSTHLADHALIQSLTMGSITDANEPHDANADNGIPDPHKLDELVDPADCYQVVDADSSQQAAILAAKRGLSMVIDGPPGTGKSQTITNIIAETLAKGETVLFVAEKSAALEVVQRRLTEAGLGDFVLELHSRQASKRAVLEEINRVLERDATGKAGPTTPAQELRQMRDKLNAYHRDLHTPLGMLAISPFQAMSIAIRLDRVPEANCDIPSVTGWSQEQLNDADGKLNALDRALARVGDESAHPWRGVWLVSAGLREKQRIKAACDGTITAITGLLDAGEKVASLLGIAAPTTRETCVRAHNDARCLLDAPAPVANVASDSRWDSPNAELAEWIRLGRRRQELKVIWQAMFVPAAEQQEWAELLQRRTTQSASLLRFLKSSWYADGKRLAASTKDGKKPPTGKERVPLTALVESASSRKRIEQWANDFAPMFAGEWQGIDSDFASLDRFANSALAIRKLIVAGAVDAAAAVKSFTAADRGQLATAVNELQIAMGQCGQCWTEWLASIGSDEKRWLKADFSTVDLASVKARLANLPSQIERLDDWIDLRRNVTECSNTSLRSFVEWALFGKASNARGQLAAIFKRHFYRLWLEEAFSTRDSLSGFRGQDHESLIEKFRELDKQWIQLSRQRLAAALSARRQVTQQPAHRLSKLGLLQAEIRKKARHMPLRKLLAAAGEVVQSIKPCFMMSPLSVAQYLAPGGLSFDLVVFDEASQVEPADAYGAIARGRQLLLVGDERQLPPTNFFSRNDPEQSAGDDDHDLHLTDLESILSLGIVRLPHRAALRWHYRSRHSSLIEFSNHEFYNDQLRVFPSPHTDCSELGLSFVHVENSVYLRGAGRFNPIEATAVAEAVMRHALEHPELSLGVGTLNQPQQRAIEDEVERLRRTHHDERVEEFFARHATGDPFFVKNLENIQGDERDVIFLSIGFGKDSNGRLHVSFGALNSEGGWRRLNVLVTRARQRCVVFSSIRADDIDLGATQARGVVALKDYLYAAEQGRLKEAMVPGGDHDSDFEANVCTALRDKGWEVHAQVGCAGFAIDLAVVDPRMPGRYLLGIECDGATYHSSPTARDRDRLRQSVLENLGWTIHRIWSTDWFHRPQMTLALVLKRLDELKIAPQKAMKPLSSNPGASGVGQHNGSEHAESRSPSPGTPGEGGGEGDWNVKLRGQTKGTIEVDSEHQRPSTSKSTLTPTLSPSTGRGSNAANSELPPGVVHYRHNRDDKPRGNSASLLAMQPGQLAAVIAQIVAVEGPIHVEETLHACVNAFDAKASARPREAFERALSFASSAKMILRQEDFLWPTNQTDVPVRYRGGGCPVTDAERICPEEYEAAVRLVLKQQFGLPFDALVEATARLMGFSRTGAKLKAAIEQSLVRLDQQQKIQLDNAKFVTLRQ